MKSKALLIGLLAAAGLMVAAGVTVAAGEVVSRPIGLNGSADDLGRSLVPDSSAGQGTTVRRTVTVRKRKPASAGASEVPANPAPGSYEDGSGTSGGGSGSSGGKSGGSGGGSGGQAKPAPPHEDAPAPSGEYHGDDESHGDDNQDDD